MNQTSPRLNRRSVLAYAAASAAGNLLPGCASQDADPGAVPATTIQAALDQLDKLVSNVMASTGVPGLAVAVVQGDRKLYAKGFGTRDISTQLPVNADTVFQLASVSKSVGATVVAREVGMGRVSWDQPLRDILPWFELSDPNASKLVTVGDMYAHRAGLPNFVGDILEEIGYSQRQILERLRYVRLEGFRAKYEYTNFGLTAGGIGVAQAVGMDWAELSQQAIYGPLGMARTSSRFDDFMRRDNRVTGHKRVDGRWVVNTLRMPDAQAPAASVTSSVNDMARWLSMLLADGSYAGRQIVAPGALASALAPQIETAPATNGRSASFYGFGFVVGTTTAGRKIYAHSGAFSSNVATNFSVVPSTGLGIVVLSNGQPIGIPEAIAGQFFDLIEHGVVQRGYATSFKSIFDALYAPAGSLVGKAQPLSPASPMALSEYAGTYRNNYYGPLQIDVVDGALVITVGPAARRYPLKHWDGNVFTFEEQALEATPGSIFMASFDKGRVTLEPFDTEGLGTFVR